MQLKSHLQTLNEQIVSQHNLKKAISEKVAVAPCSVASKSELNDMITRRLILESIAEVLNKDKIESLGFAWSIYFKK